MIDVVILDTNVLVLLIVGSTSIDLISTHKRTRSCTAHGFRKLQEAVALFDDIVVVPHILAEASNLLGDTARPWKRAVQTNFLRFINETLELYYPSKSGAQRHEFVHLGLTDAVLISFGIMQLDGLKPTLITADNDLVNVFSSAGLSVIDYHSDLEP